MIIPISQYPDNEDRPKQPLIPNGEYLFQIIDCKAKTKKAGENPNEWPYWLMKFQKVGGEDIIYDKIQFTPLIKWGTQRAKLQFSRLGFPKNQDFDCEPEFLLGKKVYLTIRTKGAGTNAENEIPFDGYRLYEESDTL